MSVLKTQVQVYFLLWCEACLWKEFPKELFFFKKKKKREKKTESHNDSLISFWNHGYFHTLRDPQSQSSPTSRIWFPHTGFAVIFLGITAWNRHFGLWDKMYFSKCDRQDALKSFGNFELWPEEKSEIPWYTVINEYENLTCLTVLPNSVEIPNLVSFLDCSVLYVEGDRACILGWLENYFPRHLVVELEEFKFLRGFSTVLIGSSDELHHLLSLRAESEEIITMN